jgi:hypothetical protein
MKSEERDLRQRTKEFGLQIVRVFLGYRKRLKRKCWANKSCDLEHRSERITGKRIARGVAPSLSRNAAIR